MASIPPPPPPPLSENKDSHLQESCYEKVQIDELTIREEIYRHFQTGDSPYFLAIYSHVHPILQHGPLCGIVALAMAGELLDDTKKVDPEKILLEAIKEGYSKKGEMFSAHAMTQLATQVFPNFEATLLDTRSSSNLRETIVHHVIEGNAVVMPYDADFNHGPTLSQNGHAAHWAILHGIAVSIGSNEHEENSVLSPILGKVKNSTILTPREISSQMKNPLKEFLHAHIKTSEMLVICHQGKSKHVGIWKLEDLLKSNDNLKEISPKILKAQDNEEDSLILFNMPEFLNGKIIVLEKKKQVILKKIKVKPKRDKT